MYCHSGFTLSFTEKLSEFKGNVKWEENFCCSLPILILNLSIFFGYSDLIVEKGL
jgi:hypothetical protein